jgi:hypothetical protein
MIPTALVSVVATGKEPGVETVVAAVAAATAAGLKSAAQSLSLNSAGHGAGDDKGAEKGSAVTTAGTLLAGEPAASTLTLAMRTMNFYFAHHTIRQSKKKTAKNPSLGNLARGSAVGSRNSDRG